MVSEMAVAVHMGEAAVVVGVGNRWISQLMTLTRSWRTIILELWKHEEAFRLEDLINIGPPLSVSCKIFKILFLLN